MTIREWSKGPAMRAALAALGVASLLFLWTLVRALRADALPAATSTAVANIDALARGVPRPPADIQAAAENDLFSADRAAPSAPFRMPGESAPDDKVRVDPPKPAVLGTAVASDGRNFATVQMGTESPKLVHVGDKIGGWIVKSIARGKVVLVSADGVRAELGGPNTEK